jgi:hypothetical protein
LASRASEEEPGLGTFDAGKRLAAPEMQPFPPDLFVWLFLPLATFLSSVSPVGGDGRLHGLSVPVPADGEMEGPRFSKGGRWRSPMEVHFNPPRQKSAFRNSHLRRINHCGW